MLYDVLHRFPRVVFFIDPIHALKPTDTSLAMMHAFNLEHWDTFFFDRSQLILQNSQPHCISTQITFPSNTPADFSSSDESKCLPLSHFDLVLIRTEPPVTAAYLNDLQILRIASLQNTLVLNSPDGIITNNEKLSVFNWPELQVPTVMSRNKQVILDFCRDNFPVVLKPLDQFGGSGVFKVQQDDPNVDVIIESISNNGKDFVVGQKYLPAVKSSGDTRILMLNGEPYPITVQRLPSGESIRSNIRVGGKGSFGELTSKQAEICKEIGGFLKSQGLVFAGLDVIGDCLNEINVTCPYFPIIQIFKEKGVNIGQVIVEMYSKLVLEHLEKQ
ncbi:hypothetical protein GEMRC1_013481 [Eukaryota sp. GEM-RC1]